MWDCGMGCLHWAVNGVLVLLTLSVATVRAVPALHGFLLYGKTHEHGGTPKPTWLAWIQRLQVPKSYFAHFYVLSTACTGVLLARHFYHAKLKLTSSTALCVLFLVHYTNRLVETASAPPSSAQMHVFHYIVGLVFYVVIACTTFLALECPAPPPPSYLWLGVCSTAFLYASYSQHCYHAHLQALPKYTLPTLGLFQTVASPHYWCEVVMYLAAAGLYLPQAPSTTCPDTRITLALVCVWVVVNLGISAEVTHFYYLERFKTALKYKMVPFVY